MRDREPTPRAVLLGASNLRNDLPFLIDHLRQRAGGAVEALTACGHGRSYGAWSRFLSIRRLPGIVGCGLWRELERRPSLPTFALVTDVGNDLIYGAGVERTAGWVEACLDRLDRPWTEITITLLPIGRLERLSPRQVRLAVSLLFPGREAPWPALLDQARELDQQLRRMGRERGLRLVEPEAAWYGLDPIHPRRRHRREVWARVISPEMGPGMGRRPDGRTRLPLFSAEETRLLGIPIRRSQPAVRLADGTSVAFY
jgi:hypothetical protein